jgi:hypothetical protein
MSTQLTGKQIKELSDAIAATGPAAHAAFGAAFEVANLMLAHLPKEMEVVTLLRETAALHLHQQQHFARRAWIEFTRVTHLPPPPQALLAPVPARRRRRPGGE